MLYAEKQIASFTINPENETIKVDAKNWTVEGSGFITWVMVIGLLLLGAAIVYGKFFHERVRGKLYERKIRKTKKQKNS